MKRFDERNYFNNDQPTPKMIIAAFAFFAVVMFFLFMFLSSTRAQASEMCTCIYYDNYCHVTSGTATNDALIQKFVNNKGVFSPETDPYRTVSSGYVSVIYKVSTTPEEFARTICNNGQPVSFVQIKYTDNIRKTYEVSLNYAEAKQ